MLANEKEQIPGFEKEAPEEMWMVWAEDGKSAAAANVFWLKEKSMELLRTHKEVPGDGAITLERQRERELGL